jgi:NDP-sugar pyrophosphorylase family protein
MPVAGEPMIRRIIGWLSAQGVTDVVLNLHHRPETLTRVVGDGVDLGVRARYSWEHPKVLGSAGGPRKALTLLPDTFLLINGDTLTDMDLAGVAAAHAESGAVVTLAVVPNREPDHYGGVIADADGRVTGFSRRGPASRDSWHFVGVQVVNRDAFASLPENEPSSSVGGAYDALIARQPGSVRAFPCEAQFWDVGTADDYLRTSLAFAPEGSVGRGARIHPTATLAGSVLWDDVAVGANASVSDCIVADGVVVPAGSTYRRSILMADGDTVHVTPF